MPNLDANRNTLPSYLQDKSNLRARLKKEPSMDDTLDRSLKLTNAVFRKSTGYSPDFGCKIKNYEDDNSNGNGNEIVEKGSKRTGINYIQQHAKKGDDGNGATDAIDSWCVDNKSDGSVEVEDADYILTESDMSMPKTKFKRRDSCVVYAEQTDRLAKFLVYGLVLLFLFVFVGVLFYNKMNE